MNRKIFNEATIDNRKNLYKKLNHNTILGSTVGFIFIIII